MKILAHRGYWQEQEERNTPAALRRALDSGFGFESDIRDFNGELVISHNIADGSCQKAEEVFRWLAEHGDKYCFAINIKADGLKDLLAGLLEKYHVTNYFTFDMSVPQMVEYADMGLTYFARQSEVEPDPVMYESAAGVWIDGFWGTEWITEGLLQGHIAAGKTVCLVSPELHGRPYADFWARLMSFRLDFGRVLLCTDRPGEAAEYFADKLERSESI